MRVDEHVVLYPRPLDGGAHNGDTIGHQRHEATYRTPFSRKSPEATETADLASAACIASTSAMPIGPRIEARSILITRLRRAGANCPCAVDLTAVVHRRVLGDKSQVVRVATDNKLLDGKI